MQNKVYAAAALATIEVVSYATLKLFPYDHWYFVVCGAFNAALVLWFCFCHTSNLAVDLSTANYAAAISQFIGWILYELYFDSNIYNSIIHALSAFQIWRLFWTENDEHTENYIDLDVFCSFNWLLTNQIAKEKI